MKELQVNIGDMLASTGLELAQAAAQQEEEANAMWEKIKFTFSMYKTFGMAQEVYDALYSAGDKVIAKKAIWYRRQKRLVKHLIDFDVDFSDMSMKEASDHVAMLRNEAKTPKQKQKDSLRMLERSMKGAVKRVPTAKVLTTLQKSIEH